MIPKKLRNPILLFLFLATMVVVVLLTVFKNDVEFHHPVIKSGSLDLSHWDFENNQTMGLNGEWEFYWGKFLKSTDEAQPDLFIDVPNNWDRYQLHGKSLPGEGYATYRLHVKTDLPAGSQLGLRIHTVSSAYSLMIDDQLVASRGTVSMTPDQEKGAYRPQVVYFVIPQSDFTITVHVSNFHNARGGIWAGMYLGSVSGIQALQDTIMGKEYFLLGSLILISMFSITLYLYRRELHYYLYFSLFCITLAVVLDIVGQFILFGLFSEYQFAFTIMIRYASTTWLVCFLTIYLHSLFPSGFSTLVVRVLLGFAVFSQLFFLLAKPEFYSKFRDGFNTMNIIGVLAAVMIVAVGTRKRYQDAWLNLASMLVFLGVFIHDTLYLTNTIESPFGEVLYLGMLLFLLLQIVIQARRVNLYYDDKAAAELLFLQAQIKPHFLFNAINTFVSISHYDMDRARALLLDFSKYLRRTFDFKSSSQHVPLSHEIELVKAYVEIEKARFEERLEVQFDLLEAQNFMIPVLTLQPIIENAINHGILPKEEGGQVCVTIRKEGDRLLFSVRDTGVGMDPILLERLKKSLSKQAAATDRVGLININRRLKQLYGKGLLINSTPGTGTEVCWSIPVHKERGEPAWSTQY